MRCMLIKAGTVRLFNQVVLNFVGLMKSDRLHNNYQLKPSGEISVIQTVQFGLEKIPLEYLEKALGEISKCVEFAGYFFVFNPETYGNYSSSNFNIWFSKQVLILEIRTTWVV